MCTPVATNEMKDVFDNQEHTKFGRKVFYFRSMMNTGIVQDQDAPRAREWCCQGHLNQIHVRNEGDNDQNFVPRCLEEIQENSSDTASLLQPLLL